MAGDEQDEEDLTQLVSAVHAEQGLGGGHGLHHLPGQTVHSVLSPRGGGQAPWGRSMFQFPPGDSNPLIEMMVRSQMESDRRHNDIMATVASLAGKDSEVVESRKRQRDEGDIKPQEPVTVSLENYKVEDDAHDKIDFKLRQLLRPINKDPKEYWQKFSFKSVERPILGSAVFLEHLMAGTINEKTLCKHADRNAFTKLENYLSKNSGVTEKSKKKLSVQEVGEDQYSMGVETKWEQASTVFEAVGGVLNYIACEHMIRQYSYTGIAMIRALHEHRCASFEARFVNLTQVLLQCGQFSQGATHSGGDLVQ